MAVKQIKNSYSSPDGSIYGTLSDGVGNLVVTTTSSTGHAQQNLRNRYAPDGSMYMTLTDGAGNLV
jgi:hypothetical protein